MRLLFVIIFNIVCIGCANSYNSSFYEEIDFKYKNAPPRISKLNSFLLDGVNQAYKTTELRRDLINIKEKINLNNRSFKEDNYYLYKKNQEYSNRTVLEKDLKSAILGTYEKSMTKAIVPSVFFEGIDFSSKSLLSQKYKKVINYRDIKYGLVLKDTRPVQESETLFYYDNEHNLYVDQKNNTLKRYEILPIFIKDERPVQKDFSSLYDVYENKGNSYGDIDRLFKVKTKLYNSTNGGQKGIGKYIDPRINLIQEDMLYGYNTSLKNTKDSSFFFRTKIYSDFYIKEDLNADFQEKATTLENVYRIGLYSLNIEKKTLEDRLILRLIKREKNGILELSNSYNGLVITTNKSIFELKASYIF